MAYNEKTKEWSREAKLALIEKAKADAEASRIAKEESDAKAAIGIVYNPKHFVSLLIVTAPLLADQLP